MLVRLSNNKKKEISYVDLCHDLEVIPEVGFVSVTNKGTISWTLGKPNEIRDLRSKVIEKGYRPSKELMSYC